MAILGASKLLSFATLLGILLLLINSALGAATQPSLEHGIFTIRYTLCNIHDFYILSLFFLAPLIYLFVFFTDQDVNFSKLIIHTPAVEDGGKRQILVVEDIGNYHIMVVEDIENQDIMVVENIPKIHEISNHHTAEITDQLCALQSSDLI